jgi:hypothetical protein
VQPSSSTITLTCLISISVNSVAQCWQLTNLGIYLGFWPWIVYASLLQDSTYWRNFSLPIGGLDDEEEHKRALLNIEGDDLNDRVKVFAQDACKHLDTMYLIVPPPPIERRCSIIAICTCRRRSARAEQQ